MGDVPLTNPVPMPPGRRWLVYALSGGLIVGHAFDVATKGEHWPISSYPMYSELTPSTFRLVRLWGYTNENPRRYAPIDPTWMRRSLMRIMRRPDAQARLRHAIVQYAEAYGPDAWAPQGFEFVGYAVFEQEWTLRADADPDRPADRMTLLFEMERDNAAIATTTTTAATTKAKTIGEAPREATR